MRLSPYRKYRFLEMIPGICIWTTFAIVISLSFIRPLWMVYFAIVFDLYWFLRVFYFIIYLFSSWRRYQSEKDVPWMESVRTIPNWQRIHHLIFIPTLNEQSDVLRHTFRALAESTYPKDKMVVVLAGEERERESFEPLAAELEREFGKTFYRFLITVHPKDIPGEIAAKGANLHYAGRQAQTLVDTEGWNYDDVIVSSFDSDTVVHPEYFSYLANVYLKHPRPTRSSYQPMALYNNNVWESPSFSRVVANSTTFWLMAELARPKPLWTFSSHSMSLRALVDVGFWQNDVVTEDSRIFLQCFIHYDGDYEVTPMYVPVSMHTAHAGTLFQTAKNLYRQQRRWAWGSEHFPFMLWHFWKANLGPRKWHLVFNLAEGMYSWATAPILITVLGYLPLWLAADVEKATVIAQTAPYVLQWLMRITMVGIFVSAVLNVYLLPTTIPGNRLLKLFVMIAQWILLPVVLIVFGSIPAIDAQTRLMLGKYLGFYTTKKVRTARVAT